MNAGQIDLQHASDLRQPFRAEELSQRFGMSADFVSVATKCGLPKGNLSLVQLCDWLTEHYEIFREEASLPPFPSIDCSKTAEDRFRSRRSRMLRTFGDFAASLPNKDFDWRVWKRNVFAAVDWSDQGDGNHPDEIRYKYKPFSILLEDAVWCATRATMLQSESNPKGYQYMYGDISRFAHLAILSSALSLEAAANCLLETLEPRGQTTKDIDKLSVFGKLDVYLLSRGKGEVLDRGHTFVQPIAELISLRNAVVHPKIEQKRQFRQIGMLYVREGSMLKALGIPSERSPNAFNAEHAQRVLGALFQFLTFYLLGLCKHPPLDMRNILFDEGLVDGAPNRHYHYQPSKEMRNAIKEWNLDARFLCLWVSRSTTVDGIITNYAPGYPEDIRIL